MPKSPHRTFIHVLVPDTDKTLKPKFQTVARKLGLKDAPAARLALLAMIKDPEQVVRIALGEKS